MLHDTSKESPTSASSDRQSLSLLSCSLRSFALGIGLLTGCEKPSADTLGQDGIPLTEAIKSGSIVSANDQSITITSKGKPVIDKLDPATINPKNEGYLVDMNCDGNIDHTILEGNKLFFSRGLGNSQFESRIQIAQLDIPVVAYRVGTLPDRGVLTPSLIFYDSDYNGYIQENRGARDDGSPILLDPESFSDGSDFNF
jgi:hypothetical protein